MLYAKETGISCDRLGLWLVCAFFTSTVAFHFYVRRCVKCTQVNKIEVVYKKVARKRSTSTLRATLHTLPGNPPQGILKIIFLVPINQEIKKKINLVNER